MTRIRYDIISNYKGNYCRRSVTGYRIDDDCAMHHEPDKWVIDDRKTGLAICSHRKRDSVLEQYNELKPRLDNIRMTEQYKTDINVFGNTTTRLDELMKEEAMKEVFGDDDKS